MPTKKRSKKQVSRYSKAVSYTKRTRVNIRKRVDEFLSRRPHRSFRRTYRRDYVRPLRLPGYWSLTAQAFMILWNNKRTFGSLILLFTLITMALVGANSQETYGQIKEALDVTSQEIFKGGWGEIGKSALLAVGSVGVGATPSADNDAQRIFSVITMLLAWLTTIYLLRIIMAGGKPKLRDGLYNAGAPIIPVALLFLVLIVQMLPVGIGVIGMTAATNYGLFEGGVVAMVFWLFMALLSCLSVYWLTSTMFAIMVATLPGMYPWQALRTAGDLVTGRRLRILYRFLWVTIITVIAWAFIFIPIVMLDGWLKSWIDAIAWMPIVPVTGVVLSIVGATWTSAYFYLLYRKVVDDDAEPA